MLCVQVSGGERRGQRWGDGGVVVVPSQRPLSPLRCSVLDVKAFERLLGPCKEIMKRNFELYKQQLHELFGSSLGIGDEEA